LRLSWLKEEQIARWFLNLIADHSASHDSNAARDVAGRKYDPLFWLGSKISRRPSKEGTPAVPGKW
jgi:hypothetical protein